MDKTAKFSHDVGELHGIDHPHTFVPWYCVVVETGVDCVVSAVGFLDAVVDFSREELTRFKDDVFIYSGDDALTKNFIENGAVGVVSVASHLVGRQIKEMINLILEDKKTEAENIHQILLPFIEAIFEEPSPGPVKHLLSESWENVGKPLLPMTDVSPELAKKLNDQYAKINI